jgi:hypothetical protein
MDSFYVLIAVNGRVDSQSIRAFLSESQIFELMDRYRNISVFRYLTHQIAVLPPDADRLMWLDVPSKTFEDADTILSSYAGPLAKRNLV